MVPHRPRLGLLASILSGVASTAILATPWIAGAHVADLSASLDATKPLPPPAVVNPGASGTGSFGLEDDLTLEVTITFANLSGPPLSAHLHQGLPGTADPTPSVDLTPILSNTSGGAGTGEGIVGPLTADLAELLLAGRLYLDIHTTDNPEGEIRGQVELEPATCRCNEAATAKEFRRCVKRQIRSVDREERKEEPLKLLRKLFLKASCGKSTGPRKAIACCLPFAPALNIVTDRMCAALPESKCVRVGGTSLGAGSSCFPSNPCSAGSPTGALIEVSGR